MLIRRRRCVLSVHRLRAPGNPASESHPWGQRNERRGTWWQDGWERGYYGQRCRRVRPTAAIDDCLIDNAVVTSDVHHCPTESHIVASVLRNENMHLAMRRPSINCSRPTTNGRRNEGPLTGRGGGGDDSIYSNRQSSYIMYFHGIVECRCASEY